MTCHTLIFTYLKVWNKEFIIGDPIDDNLEAFFLWVKPAVVSGKLFRDGNQVDTPEIVTGANRSKAEGRSP